MQDFEFMVEDLKQRVAEYAAEIWEVPPKNAGDFIEKCPNSVHAVFITEEFWEEKFGISEELPGGIK